MTSERATDRLRVDVPTLEPDPAFLGMLVHLSATSQATLPRSTRSAGFRMVLATGSVAVIAAATWAAGVPTVGGVPHTPADSPTRIGPSGTPSPGDVGTPHSDVTTTPGSPLSPGLPGSSSSSEHATDTGGADENQARGDRGDDGKSRGKKQPNPGKAKGHHKDKAKGKAVGHDRDPGAGPQQQETPPAPGGHPGATDDQDRDGGDQQRPTH